MKYERRARAQQSWKLGGIIMKKKALALALAATMTFSLTACGGGDTKGSGADGEEKLNIGVILKTQSSEFGQYLQAGCEAYGKDHPNINLEITGPSSETSYDEQLNMIQTSLDSGKYDALCVIPLQSDTAANLIKDTEIPIVAFDTSIESDKIATFVGVGNEEAAKGGAIAAVEAAKKAGWKTIECIEIAGVQGDQTNTARMKGYKAGIEEAGGDFLEDEVRYANAVADQAVVAMEGIMSTHPEGVAIICANNDDMAMAAAKAAKNNPDYKNTIFLGFDGVQAPCEGLVSGEYKNYLSVASKPYDMGYQAVESAVAAIHGEELPKFIDTGYELLTPENAEARLDTLKGYLGQK